MAVLLLFSPCTQVVCAADSFFKPDDVVALVGGEEMVMMRDHPGMEMFVVQQPGLSRVRFRNLAQEGDTVFEQFRDLNFPSWEEQFKRIGATVVISQFGRLESLGGGDPAGFIAAYERLLDRFAGDRRRVVVLSPMALGPPASAGGPTAEDEARVRNEVLRTYVAAQRALAARRGWPFVDLTREGEAGLTPMATADGVRPASCYYYGWVRAQVAAALRLDPAASGDLNPALRPLVQEKNLLWFHYWRPQNWAFLAGDRTEQPSSRDHRDPTKRWFPAEMEEWLPLIARKEGEIQEMIEASRKP